MIKRKTWVLMDRERKIIAMGVPRSRYLDFADVGEGSFRILTYISKSKAKSNRDGFYHDKVLEYIRAHYPECMSGRYGGIVTDWSFLEPVEVEITVCEL